MMNKGIVQEILGSEMAQDDPSFLEYSVKRNDILQELTNEKEGFLIINAARGTGKSGIFILLEKRLSDTENFIIKKFSTDVECPIENLPITSYANFWKNQILGWVMSQLGSQYKLAVTEAQINAVEYAEKTGEKEKNIISTLLDKLKFKGQPIEKTRTNPLVREPEIINLISRFENNFWILIDEIDDNFSGSEENKKYIVGLLLACQDISRKISNLKLRITIRPHILTLLQTEYDKIQTLREKEVEIQWNAEQLRTLLYRRLINFMKKNASLKVVHAKHVKNTSTPECLENKILGEFFDNFDMSFREKNRDVYKTLATISFNRPRWLIEYCKITFGLMEYGGKVTEDIAKIAMYEYGNNRIKFTAGEHSFLFKNILGVLNQFYNCGKTNLGQSANLKTFIVNEIIHKGVVLCNGVAIDHKALEVARLLYMVEFIRAKENLDNKDGHRFYYFRDRPDLLTNWNIRKNIQWNIHPTFAQALNIDDTKNYRDGSCIKTVPTQRKPYEKRKTRR